MQPNAQDGSNGPASPEEVRALDEEWQEASATAEFMAQQRGDMPGSLLEQLRGNRRPKADWRTLLREWMTAQAKTDYSWLRPNRRHIAHGLYLPSAHSNELPAVIVAFDTSGSVSSDMLEEFVGELNAILEALTPPRIILMQADARLHAVEELTPADLPIEPTIRGRGGTRFAPVFEHIQEELDGEDVAGLIYFTDMEASAVNEDLEPPFPVLWADYGLSSDRYQQPFGERIHLRDDA